MKDLKVSLVQLDVVWEKPDENYSLIEKLVANTKTDMIILPEMFSTGYTMNVEQNAEPINGKTTQWLKIMAAKKNCAITGSIIIKEDSQYYNQMIFCEPDGKTTHYNKRHLFRMAGEDQVYKAGDKKVIVEYRGWRINLNVCYDLRFPVWSRNNNDYDMLLNVASWPATRIEHWRALLKARAIENLSYSVGVNRVGEDENKYKYTGYSSAFTPSGECLTEIVNKEEVSTIVLSYEDLINYRKKFPFNIDRDSYQIKI